MKKIVLTLTTVWIMVLSPLVLFGQALQKQMEREETGSQLRAYAGDRPAFILAVGSYGKEEHAKRPAFAFGNKSWQQTEMSLFQEGEGMDSPYRLSWKTEGILVGAGMAVGAIGYSLDGSRMELSREQAAGYSRKDIPWFDRSATYKYSKDLKKVSDQLGLFALVAPLGLLLDREVRSDFTTVGIMFLETRLLATVAPVVAKRAVKRYRPFVYNPDVSYEDKVSGNPGESFFANQTTSVFSSAVFIATVFGDYHPDSKLKPYVWAGSLLAAGAISYVRHDTGSHYPSDILVGALVGSAIGYGVPKLHKLNKGKVAFTPVVQPEGYSMNARLTF